MLFFGIKPQIRVIFQTQQKLEKHFSENQYFHKAYTFEAQKDLKADNRSVKDV